MGDHVDGGTYGRPITLEGVRAGYTKYGQRFDERFAWRAGTLQSTSSYYLLDEDREVGHIDCLLVDSPVLGGVNGWLFMVYVIPEGRGRGYGKRMVELACRS